MAHKVNMTRHALQRALDMRLEPWQIQRALHDPKVIPTDTPGTEFWRKGRIALVVKTTTEPPTVATILWSTERAFQKDMRIAPYADRSRSTFTDVHAS